MKKCLLIAMLLSVVCIEAQITIKMQKEGGVYTIPCSVNGIKLKFIFDTGASNVSISITEARFLLKNGYLKNEDILSEAKFQDAAGKINVGTIINIREFEFSGLILYNVKATIVHELSAPLLLGQTAMSKLGKFQFDPNNGTLTIMNNSTNTTPNKNSIADDSDDNNITFAVKQDDKEEISNFTKAIKIKPNNREPYIGRAIAKNNIKDFQGAIADFTKAIEIEPNNPKNSIIFSNRGTPKLNLKNYQGAIADFTKALEIDPNNPNTYFWRGKAKSSLKDLKGAIADFNKALEIAKNNLNNLSTYK
jgi:clan AA aspartic protease (TIGR02281 family)